MRPTTSSSWIAIAAIAAFAVALAPLPAGAETLYKLIDKNGKVTYVQEPPKHFDGQVIPVQIDPKANTATFPKPPPAKPAAAPAKAGDASQDRVAQARARVEKARKALEDARDNPGEGDIRRIGKVGGGTRPVPSAEYQQRLASLERELKQAEEELVKAERAR